MKIHFKVLVSLALTFWFISCCSSDNSETINNEKPLIVCTTGMLGDALQNLLGDQATVISLMGPGVDPHLYKATQGDLAKLQNADLIIYNGLYLEGKMAEVMQKLARQKTIIAAAELLPDDKIRYTVDDVTDPHIWFDVALWAEMIQLLIPALEGTNIFDAELLRQNGSKFIEELQELDQWTTTEINKIPTEKRVLVTAHDAFQYFGLAYDIEVYGLQGLSTLSEFGLRDVSDLVSFLVQRQISSIYVESSVSDKAIKAVVEGCRAEGHNVQIGGSLFSDAMGEAGTEKGTYIGMVKHNVSIIVAGLGGQND
jgi:manganese/zinc/iron transport system substrate-binding protein